MSTRLTSLWPALRRRVLTPGRSATTLRARGFPEKDRASRDLLEAIGGCFLDGYAAAAQARTPAESEDTLDRVPLPLRGFAYEGAAMGFAVRDGLPLGRHDHVSRMLRGRGDAHIYMVYVGVGWAMARLPRFRWRTLTAPDPLLRWLVLDGYGFHQAYFHTRRYVYEHYREPAFPWPPEGPRSYAARVIDQGIGRAAWFVAGTDVRLLGTLLDRFPASRRPDLYSGAGLAATYAGGADEPELRWLWEHAGAYRPQLAQGSCFAASARLRAGLVVPHNDLATGVFCGLTAEEAAKVCDRTLPPQRSGGREPAYELWRRAIAQEFVSVGRG